MNLVRLLSEMKRIYGICPCCGEPFQLSEAEIFTRSRPPRTVFEKVDDACGRLQRRIEKFEEDEEQMREEARRIGQLAARRRLRQIAPFFSGRGIDPQDVKLIFHPVQYVAFKGMQKNLCASVDFIDHPPTNREQEVVHKSLNKAIRAGNLEWQTFRIGDDGRFISEAQGGSRFSFDS